MQLEGHLNKDASEKIDIVLHTAILHGFELLGINPDSMILK